MKLKARNSKKLELIRNSLEETLNSEQKISFSPHLTLYAHLTGCDPKKLQDEKFITSTLLASIVQGRMRLVSLSVLKFKGGGEGVTAIGVISESHIVVNTYPETTSLTLDVYACSGYPINVMYEFLRRFKPKDVEFVILPRSIKDESVQSRVILGEGDIKDKNLRRWMEKRNLLPLINTSEEFLILANLVGFVFGNGYLHKNLNHVTIWQKNRHVLWMMKKKLERIGIKAKIKPKINKAGKEVFELYVNDKNLCKLLFLLGAPKGSKIKQKLRLPKWIRKDELPICGVFLSSFLFSKFSKSKGGCIEKGTPIPYITLTLSTKSENEEEMERFVREVKEILEEFYIKVNKIRREKYEDCVRFVLQIRASKNNLMRLQALVSLTKIFPLNIFNPSFNLSQTPPLYAKNSGFYKIIDYLLKHKASYSKEIICKTKISPQNGYKWLKLLNHHNIIKRERKGRKIFVKLNMNTDLE